MFRRATLQPGEEICFTLKGWIGGAGEPDQRKGQLILTNHRVCFYGKGWLQNILQTFWLSEISEVKARWTFGFGKLWLRGCNGELVFKSFVERESFDEVCRFLRA